MEINERPWEWVADTSGGGYQWKKADPETRARQLEEYKKKRRIELNKQLREVEMLH